MIFKAMHFSRGFKKLFSGKGILILTFFSVSMLELYAQELSFPGAKGWAAATPGGRGGRIIKVTSPEAEGKGSFLEAVKTKGRRIIVFEVGGS
ncbi:MAG: hypothetical protein ABS46_08120 [Cytophagaceae bacterium SCN 52-12]|nr:MAG: hypothetical protein ABS46_08120 [Cytophagaceae bacterium SCN 52-12]